MDNLKILRKHKKLNVEDKNLFWTLNKYKLHLNMILDNNKKCNLHSIFSLTIGKCLDWRINDNNNENNSLLLASWDIKRVKFVFFNECHDQLLELTYDKEIVYNSNLKYRNTI